MRRWQEPLRIRCRREVLTVLALSAVLSSGCSPRPSPEGFADLSFAMRTHYYAAIEIQDAVIEGDVEATRPPGRWLAEHLPRTNLPEGSEQYVEEIVDLGLQLSRVEAVADASDLLARIAFQCGSCHQRFDGGPKVERAPPWGSQRDLTERMRRHAWAAGRLWDGLLAPSDTVWLVGALELSSTPLTPERTPERIADEELVKLAESVHQMALEGLELEGRAARAQLYGRLLATCAECHELIGMRHVLGRGPP